MRLHTIGLIGIAALALSGAARAQSNPFAGAWNITPEAPATGVYWLEVKDEGGKPAVMFLNRGGSPVAAAGRQAERRRAVVHGRRHRAEPSDGHASRRRATSSRGTVGQTKVTGERPPTWGACDANAKHTFGKPVDAVRRQVARRVGRPDEGPGDHVVDRRRRHDQRAARQQPGVEGEVQGLPARRGIQGVGEGQQRHLPARPLRDAGAGRRRPDR